MVSAHQSVGATKITKLAENLKLAYESASRIILIGADIDDRSRETQSP